MYRPRSPEEVCGNPGVMAALSMWLGEWKEKRRRGGPGDGSGRGLRASGSGDDSGEESEVQYTALVLYSSGLGLGISVRIRVGIRVRVEGRIQGTIHHLYCCSGWRAAVIVLFVGAICWDRLNHFLVFFRG